MMLSTDLMVNHILISTCIYNTKQFEKFRNSLFDLEHLMCTTYTTKLLQNQAVLTSDNINGEIKSKFMAQKASQTI